MATVGATRIQTSYWRIAGLSFPRYANLTARVLRKSVKPDVARAGKFADRDTEKMSFRTWTNGKRGALETMKPYEQVAAPEKQAGH